MPRRKAERVVISQDEATEIPSWSARYWLLLNDADASLLAAGRMPTDLPARCQSLLSWKCDQEQVDEALITPLLVKESA